MKNKNPYNTMLALLYQELGLESLQLCCWYRKCCLFYKIFKNKSLAYLFNLIPARNTHYLLGTSDNIPCFNTKYCKCDFLVKFIFAF